MHCCLRQGSVLRILGTWLMISNGKWLSTATGGRWNVYSSDNYALGIYGAETLFWLVILHHIHSWFLILVCVCVCMCVCACAHACMHACMRVCVRVCVFVSTTGSNGSHAIVMNGNEIYIFSVWGSTIYLTAELLTNHQRELRQSGTGLKTV